MRKYALALIVIAGTILFIVLGFAIGDKLKVSYMEAGKDLRHTAAAGTPAAAVENLFINVQRRDYQRAYGYVHNQQEIDQNTFELDITGRDGSLRTLSALQDMEVQQLGREGEQAKVRAHLQWATALGRFDETRDLNVANTSDGWKVDWVSDKQAKVPAQIIPVSYPRWDVFRSGSTGVNVNEKLPEPKVRVISQSLGQDADSVVLVGEVENQDTVPAFVAVKAVLEGDGGKIIGDESSGDGVIHTLLPGKKSPFRIDFPSTNRSAVKNVKLQVSSTLVSGSGDPVIEVQSAKVESAEGNPVIHGQVTNRSGLAVNIPQVLATIYDGSGKVIWVEKTYLDRALLPGTPMDFAMRIPSEFAAQARNVEVSVNSYRNN